MDGYIDFRFALKEAEVVARELQVEMQIGGARGRPSDGLAACAEGGGGVHRRRGRGGAVQARAHPRPRPPPTSKTSRTGPTSCIKDIAENLSIGYDVGETLVIAKLQARPTT